MHTDTEPANTARLRAEVERRPSSARAQARLGMALYRVGQPDAAEHWLRRALDLDPELQEAWVNLGGVLFSRWKFKESLEANARVLARNPQHVQALHNQGLTHLYLDHPQEMLECFQRVAELEPDNASAHYHLAVGQNAMGLVEAAQNSLQLAEELGFSPEPELVKDIQNSLSQKQAEPDSDPELGTQTTITPTGHEESSDGTV